MTTRPVDLAHAVTSWRRLTGCVCAGLYAYNGAASSIACASRPALDSARMKSSPRSAPAAWARFIARAIAASGAMSPSRSFRPRSRPTRAAARFEQEARAAAALKHPNILAVYDVGPSPTARPYIVSELLTDRRCVSGSAAARCPCARRSRYAIQIAQRAGRGAREGDHPSRSQTREHLHHERWPREDSGFRSGEADRGRAGVSGTACCHDAAANGPGVVIGTAATCRPSRCAGTTVDHRTDIFAFGAVLYEMLSGRRAFGGDTPMDAMSAIIKEDPPDLPRTDERHIPPALARIVDRCLEKNPAARFQSAGDLAFALEALSWHSRSQAMVAECACALPAGAEIRIR